MRAVNDNPRMPAGDQLMAIGLCLGTLTMIALGALTVAARLGGL